MLTLRVGEEIERNEVLVKLVEMQYARNDLDFHRGTFRVRGDVLEIIPTNQNQTGYRIEFFGSEIDRISEIDVLTGTVISNKKNVSIFPEKIGHKIPARITDNRNIQLLHKLNHILTETVRIRRRMSRLINPSVHRPS